MLKTDIDALAQGVKPEQFLAVLLPLYSVSRSVPALETVVPAWLSERQYQRALQDFLAKEDPEFRIYDFARAWLEQAGGDISALEATVAARNKPLFYKAFAHSEHVLKNSWQGLVVVTWYTDTRRHKIQGLSILVDHNPPWHGAAKDLMLLPVMHPVELEHSFLGHWRKRMSALDEISASEAKTLIIRSLETNRKQNIRLPKDLVAASQMFHKQVLALDDAPDTPLFTMEDFELLSKTGRSAEMIWSEERTVGRRITGSDGREIFIDADTANEMMDWDEDGGISPAFLNSLEPTERQNLMKSLENIERWNPKNVSAMSTEDIIAQLRAFGVEFDHEQFMRDVQGAYSVVTIGDNFQESSMAVLEPGNQFFFVSAAEILWEHLAPDVPRAEQLTDDVDEGYDFVEDGDSVGAVEQWLVVWEQFKHLLDVKAQYHRSSSTSLTKKIKQLFKHESDTMKSVEEAGIAFASITPLEVWLEEVSMELANAGLEDVSWYSKRLHFLEEVLQRFPKSNAEFLCAMHRDEAETYFRLGNAAEGERLFQSLVQEYPDDVWHYIRWGDQYTREKDVKLNDYDRAEKIYRMALERDLDDDDTKYVTERLENLEKERIA